MTTPAKRAEEEVGRAARLAFATTARGDNGERRSPLDEKIEALRVIRTCAEAYPQAVQLHFEQLLPQYLAGADGEIGVSHSSSRVTLTTLVRTPEVVLAEDSDRAVLQVEALRTLSVVLRKAGLRRWIGSAHKSGGAISRTTRKPSSSSSSLGRNSLSRSVRVRCGVMEAQRALNDLWGRLAPTESSELACAVYDAFSALYSSLDPHSDLEIGPSRDLVMDLTSGDDDDAVIQSRVRLLRCLMGADWEAIREWCEGVLLMERESSTTRLVDRDVEVITHVDSIPRFCDYIMKRAVEVSSEETTTTLFDTWETRLVDFLVRWEARQDSREIRSRLVGEYSTRVPETRKRTSRFWSSLLHRLTAEERNDLETLARLDVHDWSVAYALAATTSSPQFEKWVRKWAQIDPENEPDYRVAGTLCLTPEFRADKVFVRAFVEGPLLRDLRLVEPAAVACANLFSFRHPAETVLFPTGTLDFALGLRELDEFLVRRLFSVVIEVMEDATSDHGYTPSCEGKMVAWLRILGSLWYHSMCSLTRETVDFVNDLLIARCALRSPSRKIRRSAWNTAALALHHKDMPPLLPARLLPVAASEVLGSPTCDVKTKVAAMNCALAMGLRGVVVSRGDLEPVLTCARALGSDSRDGETREGAVLESGEGEIASVGTGGGDQSHHHYVQLMEKARVLLGMEFRVV